MGSRWQAIDGANSRLPDRRHQQNHDDPRPPRQLRHAEGDEQQSRWHSRDPVARHPGTIGVAEQIEGDRPAITDAIHSHSNRYLPANARQRRFQSSEMTRTAKTTKISPFAKDPPLHNPLLSLSLSQLQAISTRGGPLEAFRTPQNQLWRSPALNTVRQSRVPRSDHTDGHQGHCEEGTPRKPALAHHN